MKKQKTDIKFQAKCERKIESLLPRHPNTHRLGNGRLRVSDRKVMADIFFCLVSQLPMERIE